jgi:hypothetical protein
MYFREIFDEHDSACQVLKSHLDTQVLPYLESLVWHPTLTYQTTMHTDKSYFQADQKNYMAIGIFRRNITAITKAVFKNLINIFR